MGVIAELLVDSGRVALGLTPFSLLLWAYVSIILLLVGPAFVQVAPQIVDPPARLLATDPVRVVIWMPLSLLALISLTALLLITIFGALLMPIVALLVAMAGYLALARLVGEQAGHALGLPQVAPWLAAAIGIAAFRLVRLVPYAGAPAHTLIVWIGCAAASCAFWRAARAWYRRRLPDETQFRGETLVEWYPDGDPIDGKPSIGTGRPVLDNVRGEEDRASTSEDAETER